MDKVHNELEQNPSQKEKKLGEILKPETPQETIYYTCPHQQKMTEPNCKICLGKVEKELKRFQEEKSHREETKEKSKLPPYTETENVFGNSTSNVHITTNSICPKC